MGCVQGSLCVTSVKESNDLVCCEDGDAGTFSHDLFALQLDSFGPNTHKLSYFTL